jgi:hypothetical protein
MKPLNVVNQKIGFGQTLSKPLLTVLSKDTLQYHLPQNFDTVNAWLGYLQKNAEVKLKNYLYSKILFQNHNAILEIYRYSDYTKPIGNQIVMNITNSYTFDYALQSTKNQLVDLHFQFSIDPLQSTTTDYQLAISLDESNTPIATFDQYYDNKLVNISFYCAELFKITVSCSGTVAAKAYVYTNTETNTTVSLPFLKLDIVEYLDPYSFVVLGNEFDDCLNWLTCYEVLNEIVANALSSHNNSEAAIAHYKELAKECTQNFEQSFHTACQLTMFPVNKSKASTIPVIGYQKLSILP